MIAPKTHFLFTIALAPVFLIIFSVFFPDTLYGQSLPEKDSTVFIKVKASEKYNKSKKFQKRWGKNYRQEWNTPVVFRKAYLDTLAGGVTVYELGGGRQSKSLMLRDASNREYVLRSIDKSFGKALPEITQNTFLEKIADDQVSIGHPYASLTIPPMATAAKIFHTKPSIYFIPSQPSLGKYNDSMGNNLYLFEKRPDENWKTADNFGNPENTVGTEKMLEKIYKDNDKSVDQLLYVRSRLFDMFIGDWGRHEDRWRWGEFKDGNKTVFKPIPRDRDQAYSKFEGSRLRLFISAAGLKHLQTFDYTIKDISTYNFPARNLDYHITNEVTLDQWITIAKELQAALTDKVIENAIKQFPPEIYPISGPEIIAKLKSRRNALPVYAEKYFRLMAYEVEIRGSEDKERFEVLRLSDTTTEINIFKITKEGEIKKEPYYHRIFKNKETKEIRIYGLDGKDQYSVKGNVEKGIKLRLIGGPDKDTYMNESIVNKNGRRTKIYDNRDNEFKPSRETALRLSSDTSIHSYKYAAVAYDKRSFRPIVYYSNEDRIYGGLAYSFQKHQWRKDPYGFKQYLDVKYSISQKAFSTTYKSSYPQLLGKWDLGLLFNYDDIRWTNFYGLGNNSLLTTSDRDFNRVRSHEFIAASSLQRVINNRHRISLTPFFQTYKLINDTERFLSKDNPNAAAGFYNTQQFAGAALSYLYQVLNDSILPTKGVAFLASSSYTSNIKNKDRSFGKYAAELNVYLPISKKISIAVKGGGSTLTGTPEFYNYNQIGSKTTLRGYQRDRFYGNSTFYNQNELRFISNVRSFIYNGKIGVFGLYDAGRVWLDGENTNNWHTSYGAGLIFSPFNRLSFSIAYAKSTEDNNIHLALLKAL
ncbi:MAG: BamA/TamA family outer membrane protein [Ferruginibacter sp.]